MVIHPISCGLAIAFLIETSQGLFLVDSGSPGKQECVLAKMRQLGRTDLKIIWITHAHYDHYGSAAALREKTGARIGVHPADADSMTTGRSPLGSSRSYGFIYLMAQQVLSFITPLPPTEPDFVLDDDQTLEPFGLNASILHTPGHTPGHTCVLLEGGITFVADLIANFPWPRLQGLLATDWGQLHNSLTRLIETQPNWIYTGHYKYPRAGKMLETIK